MAADPIALLSRAVDQTGELIAAIKPEQAELPTPCRSWDVRALVNHIVDELGQFATITSGGERHHLGVDLIGDDWTGAYREAARRLMDAWRQPGALDRTIHLRMGDVPARWTVDQQITELVIHAWDVAKATGQPTDLDPELGEYALAWGRRNLRPEYRGEEDDGAQIGPEKPVADDAPLYDRLAAFGGRDPE